MRNNTEDAMNRTFRVVVLLVLLATAWAGTALALQVYKGPTEITGTVVQVYSGNSFSIFDGERTSVVVLEGVKTPKRGEADFLESANFLHQMLYQKKVRVLLTRKAEYITYGVVVETEGNVNVNAQVLAQPYAEEEVEITLGGAVASMTLRGNEFHSVPAGFSMTKSDDWVFLSAEDVKTGEEVIRLDDRELERAIKNRTEIPLVTITKYPEPYANLNPSISIHVKSTGGLLGRAPEALLESVIPGLKESFSDFTIIEGPEPASVSGRRAAYLKASYTIVEASGKAYKTVSHVYLVPRGPVMFMITMSSLATDEANVREDFDKMLASIRIER